jgi:hypothetical protein
MSGQEGLTLYRMSRRFPAGRAAQDRKAIFALETASFLVDHNGKSSEYVDGMSSAYKPWSIRLSPARHRRC